MYKVLKGLAITMALVGLLVVGGKAFAVEKELIGAGATFPQPFYSKMFDQYFKQFGIKVNYQGIGSGGGIKQLINRTVDFGGTDAFMTDQEMKEAAAPVIHIPTCLGAVVMTYNLPGNPQLKFTPDVIVDMFLGKIKKWNDPRITTLNPGSALPDLAVSIIHRSDGSGTTYIFSDYLTKVSKDWKEKVGTGKSLNWPVGLGAKGNPGVAGLVKQVPGSFGYVELIYALGNKMAVGTVKNKAGIFVQPSIKSVSLAADVVLPDDTNISLTDTSAKEGYPISGFTWIMAYKEQNFGGRTKEKAEELVKLLRYSITDGQKFAEALHYAPLSRAAVAKSEKILKSMTFGGSPIWK
jgi:phosphate transport system substrate-binding protein